METKPIIATGIDAGSNYTRVVILQLLENRMRFLGCGCAPSTGWTKSRIVDQGAVGAGILAAVEQAEGMARTLVESAVAGFGGLSIEGISAEGPIDLRRPRDVANRDVDRAMDKAMSTFRDTDRMILQAQAQEFVVDDDGEFQDPRQHLAARIVAHAHLITASAKEHATLVHAVNAAHLSVDETVFEGNAACYASVLPDDRREGVAVLDIGAHSSELVCYFGDSLQVASTLKICGDHFTRDLAHALCVPFEDALLVKEEFGHAVSSDTAVNSVVELPFKVGPDGGTGEVSRRHVNQILESRAIELFEMVRTELTRVGAQRSITNGLVLTGGGALLPGLCDVAERVLQQPARIGLAQGILHWPDELKDPAWTTAAGLSMYSARLRDKVDVDHHTTGMLGRILR